MTVPDPTVKVIPIEFTGIPRGGQVNISIGFYMRSATPSARTTGAPVCSTGLIDDTVDTAPDTAITEVQMPIQSTTQYLRTRKSSLNQRQPFLAHDWDRTAVRRAAEWAATRTRRAESVAVARARRWPGAGLRQIRGRPSAAASMGAAVRRASSTSSPTSTPTPATTEPIRRRLREFVDALRIPARGSRQL